MLAVEFIVNKKRHRCFRCGQRSRRRNLISFGLTIYDKNENIIKEITRLFCGDCVSKFMKKMTERLEVKND